MKQSNTILLIIICFSSLLAQNNDGKKIGLLIKERTSFYSVDDQYNLLTDTIYHSDDGFRVYSGYDIEKSKDGKEYVILRYPKWKNNSQVKEKIIQQQENLLIDSLFLESINSLFRNDPAEAKMYTDILDSLTALSKLERKKKSYHVDIVGRDGLKLALSKETFDRLELEGKIADIYSLEWRHSTKLASGFMTVPFKLRPKQDSVNFNMTTDITLGAYIGVKKRVSRKTNNFIVIPATLGLSYINIGNSETSNVNTKDNSSVIPGWTWSSGIVFDLNGFNVGLVFGQDFASGVGDNWLYNKKMWYSFSIGYSFFNSKDK